MAEMRVAPIFLLGYRSAAVCSKGQVLGSNPSPASVLRKTHDNLNVFRGVAKVIDSGIIGTPLLIKGDLLAVIHSMWNLRGEGTVKVSKVKGHATQTMVDNGDARHEDFVGNDGAEKAAYLGRYRQQDGVISARHTLIWVRRHRYPIMMELHMFTVAISRIEVNHDG